MSDPQIRRAVDILRAGGLVAFPTETVYGLGADAANAEAVRRIFAVKGRPAGHPLIVHLAPGAELTRWARAVPRTAHILAARFWPGPLTLVLPRARGVLDEVTGGQDTVGLRMPAHPLAQALLVAFGGGLAAPSANRFGRISPTTARHVADELGDRVDLILDGGACQVGIESTIIDLSSGAPVLLRPGRITQEEIEALLDIPVGARAAASPRVSGTLAAHYAPRVPLRLVPPEQLEAVAQAESARRSVGVLASRPQPAATAVKRWLRASDDPLDYAHDLYAALRALDQPGCDLIVIECPPPLAAWAAVHDRLGRAAAGSGAGSGDAT